MKQEPQDEDDCCIEESTVERLSSSAPLTSLSSLGLDNLDNAAQRVRSHSSSLRAMANPSAVWAHFDLCSNDPLRAQCRICGAIVVRGGANPRQCGTTNLHRHLRVHHGGQLIGRRYHVTPNWPKGQTPGKNIKLSQSFIRPQIRKIAPTPFPQRQQQSMYQHTHRPPKTLVLKTIPLKVKQVAPTTIKMNSRSLNPQSSVPQNVPRHQPTEVCLRWNSYHSNMQNSFPSLLDSEEFVDVTLACEGRSLKCHKMILSSCSDYLAGLLRENPCKHPIILMKDLKFWEVEALVKFMYRGEVNVEHEKLPQLLNAAEALQIKGLATHNSSSSSQKDRPLPKPPMLIPQPKPQLISKPQTTNQLASPGIKGNPVRTIPILSPAFNVKRSQKRPQTGFAETLQPFTKIRLQKPLHMAPSTVVKLEPLDIPLSPTEMITDNNQENNPMNSNVNNDVVDSNKKGEEREEEDVVEEEEEEDEMEAEDEDEEEEEEEEEEDFNQSPDSNDAEDPIEFIPTDFLDQEQDIIEELEIEHKDHSESGNPMSFEDEEDDTMNEEKGFVDGIDSNKKTNDKEFVNLNPS